MSEITVLRRFTESRFLSLPFIMCGYKKKMARCSPEEGCHQNSTIWHPDLGLPASRTVRKKRFLLFISSQFMVLCCSNLNGLCHQGIQTHRDTSEYATIPFQALYMLSDLLQLHSSPASSPGALMLQSSVEMPSPL